MNNLYQPPPLRSIIVMFSLIAIVVYAFSRFTLCLPVNSRITLDPFQTLIQDSLEFWRTGFRIPCQWKFDSGNQSLVEFWIPWGRSRSPKPGIHDSTRKNFRDFGIRIPLHWGKWLMKIDEDKKRCSSLIEVGWFRHALSTSWDEDFSA